MNLRVPLVLLTAATAPFAVTACDDDDDDGGNVTVETTSPSAGTNDENPVNTTVPGAGASIPPETMPAPTAAP